MLINNAMQQPTAPSPSGPQAGQSAPNVAPAGQEPVDPKTIYRELGKNAMEIIYDEQSSQKLVEQMQAGADDPIAAVAQAAVMILEKLQQSVKSVNPKVAYAVAPLIVVLLLELAETAKAFQVDPGMIPTVLKKVGEMTKYEDAPPPQGGSPEMLSQAQAPSAGAAPMIPQGG